MGDRKWESLLYRLTLYTSLHQSDIIHIFIVLYRAPFPQMKSSKGTAWNVGKGDIFRVNKVPR